MLNKKIRVLLADDHKILRKGVRMLIDSQPDMEVVGEAKTGREAIEQHAIEHVGFAGDHWIRPVLFVSQRTHHDRPAAVAFFEHVVEAADTYDVVERAVDRLARGKREARLRHRPAASEFDRGRTGHVRAHVALGI